MGPCRPTADMHNRIDLIAVCKLSVYSLLRATSVEKIEKNRKF